MSTPAKTVPIARGSLFCNFFLFFGRPRHYTLSSLAQVINPEFSVNSPTANNKGSDIPSRVLYELLYIQHPSSLQAAFEDSLPGIRILLSYPKTGFLNSCNVLPCTRIRLVAASPNPDIVSRAASTLCTAIVLGVGSHFPGDRNIILFAAFRIASESP